ncbi:MAG: hypothetical protein QGI78_04570 [Phycisphaerales bacterium]|nr:hypothetical protein [Phycisphaerales bacterium]
MQSDSVRIVSLSPAITATLVDAGLEEQVVGCSAFCKLKGEVPVIGDLHTIDYEKLLRTKPTHVFVQQQVVGNDTHLQHLHDTNAFTLRTWKLNTIKEIESTSSEIVKMFNLPVNPFRFQPLNHRVDEEPTLLISNGSEHQLGVCFGKGTYLDDVWTAMGGVNALQTQGWRVLSIEDIARLAPVRIILVSDIQITNNTPLSSLNIPVTPFVHEDVLLPSTRISDVAQALYERWKEAK